MKIVFNILRPNWYRVLAAPIQEAISRRWQVECWHGYMDGEHQIKAKPVFHDSAPVIRIYKDSREFIHLIKTSVPDVVVDADMLPIPTPEACKGLENKPLSILVDGITNPRRLQSGARFACYDCFAVPSVWYINETIRLGMCDTAVVQAEIHQALGRMSELLLKRNFSARYRWTDEDVEYYRSHAVVFGTPSLDDLRLVDRDAVRKKWGILSDKKVVALLPSPYDMPLGYLWGDLNVADQWWNVLWLVLKHRQIGRFVEILRKPRDLHILRTIKRFCEKNDALLVAKLRHSRVAPRRLKSVADVIVGEDGFFPHTALELYSIADVVFGFTSSGAYESVAAGTPYIDIELPYFPKDLYIRHIGSSLEPTKPWSGAVWSFTAEELVSRLPEMSICQFRMDEKNRETYLDKFTSGCDGKGSVRLMDWIEKRVQVDE